jgi:cation transport regulator ChaC
MQSSAPLLLLQREMMTTNLSNFIPVGRHDAVVVAAVVFVAAVA